jgi:hypothetical protein
MGVIQDFSTNNNTQTIAKQRGQKNCMRRRVVAQRTFYLKYKKS